jgi:hypothetical protein
MLFDPIPDLRVMPLGEKQIEVLVIQPFHHVAEPVTQSPGLVLITQRMAYLHPETMAVTTSQTRVRRPGHLSGSLETTSLPVMAFSSRFVRPNLHAVIPE